MNFYAPEDYIDSSVNELDNSMSRNLIKDTNKGMNMTADSRAHSRI